MKKIFIAACVAALSFPAFAGNEETSKEASLDAAVAEETPEYGIGQTGFASKPKFGAYIIGSYKYSDLESANGGPGFGVRLVRAYVDGSIYNDFKYRLQVELNGTPHIKDFYLEWAKWKEFSVKMGQFKRAFTFENPYNPWDVGTGDYSQLVKKLAGMGDRNGEASMGGRDLGLQFQGDLFPIGSDKHRLVHYQLGVYNGNGINKTDNNKDKDLIGTIQFQPVKDLYIGAFGWKGNYSNGTTTVDRNRYSFGVKYEHDNWTFRSEYAHSYGGKLTDVNSLYADALYATVGIPVKPWFKLYVKYDNYRDDLKVEDKAASTIYSIAPNFRLHKNLNFQLEYRYNDNKLTGKKYNELWFEYYVRF